MNQSLATDDLVYRQQAIQSPRLLIQNQIHIRATGHLSDW